ncbi:hypothetical protein J6G99_00210 [bacterium]|nr:hypothetical protein [bacterium]
MKKNKSTEFYAERIASIAILLNEYFKTHGEKIYELWLLKPIIEHLDNLAEDLYCMYLNDEVKL